MQIGSWTKKTIGPCQWLISFMLVYMMFACVFFASTHNQLKYGEKFIAKESGGADSPIGELHQTDKVQQAFLSNNDVIAGVALLIGTYSRENNDKVSVAIIDQYNNKVLASQKVDTRKLIDNAFVDFNFSAPIEGIRDKALLLEIASDQGFAGNAVSLYKSVSISSDEAYIINGRPVSGGICFKLISKPVNSFEVCYWLFVLVTGVFFLIYGAWAIKRHREQKRTYLFSMLSAISSYHFLLSQLVSRDFKTKYKRSVLGVFWSLLNPLLTMIVQYVVFSNLFRFDIPNYPVYLLSGIVLFNYMAEATSQSMSCIIQNASLINKVYMPKYIYPLARVLSCSVNFLFALIALYLVILITSVPISLSHIFILFSVFCMFLFICGLSLLLAALMVFFRDIQFLYGVFLQMWMYLTPIFYPENILPPWVMNLMTFNPMYHFLKFTRIIILEERLPEIQIWLSCAVFAIVPLVIGIYFFRKYQNRFILYI